MSSGARISHRSLYKIANRIALFNDEKKIKGILDKIRDEKTDEAKELIVKSGIEFEDLQKILDESHIDEKLTQFMLDEDEVKELEKLYKELKNAEKSKDAEKAKSAKSDISEFMKKKKLEPIDLKMYIPDASHDVDLLKEIEDWSETIVNAINRLPT